MCTLKFYLGIFLSERIQALNPKGVILSGGPESVTNSNTPRAPEIIFELGIPILGICYGMQTLAEQFGGQVASSKIKEFGHAQIALLKILLVFLKALILAPILMYG